MTSLHALEGPSRKELIELIKLVLHLGENPEVRAMEGNTLLHVVSVLDTMMLSAELVRGGIEIDLPPDLLPAITTLTWARWVEMIPDQRCAELVEALKLAAERPA